MQADGEEEDYYDVWADYADYDNEDQLKNQVRGIQNKHHYFLHMHQLWDKSTSSIYILEIDSARYKVSHYQTMTTLGGINVSKYGTKRKDTEEEDQVLIINYQFLLSIYMWVVQDLHYHSH